MAFGLRNVSDTVRGIDEMIRVARPGGKVAILEFSRPRGRFLGRLYLAFFRHVLPRIGQALAPNADDAYHYLPRACWSSPTARRCSTCSPRAGWPTLEQYPLTFGIATLYVGTKPARPPGDARRSRPMTPARPSRTDDLVVAMTGASGAPYAVRLLQSSAGSGRTVHLTISPSAVQVLREETGPGGRPRTRFDPPALGDPRPGGSSIIITRTSRRGSPAARSRPAAWSSSRAA